MKSIKAMARMEVLTKHQMSWKADANSPQQMEAEALFNTIDTLGDGNGTQGGEAGLAYTRLV